MQDIHWTDGGFGYFPSYTLGAMYAAQLFHAAKTALPGLQTSIAGGDFSALFDWLRQNIWQHGSRFSTSQLITRGHGRRPEYPLLPRTPDIPLPVTECAGDLPRHCTYGYTPIPITHGNPEFTGI